jgi:hypothetical protein
LDCEADDENAGTIKLQELDALLNPARPILNSFFKPGTVVIG